jgi:hypothetical protein
MEALVPGILILREFAINKLATIIGRIQSRVFFMKYPKYNLMNYNKLLIQILSL